ncbi:PREDICTED: uncharacterized protein LOC109323533 [Crocodylus porosus]|uniref:uncharacterized protein LOC109323533 n=1 Tax=Crocodylus porosus TaxID=8502 RepID=UPI00093D1283|nr:PREDICTED: uncharacterized protein LOC109323533 [Crocodylus porosus]
MNQTENDKPHSGHEEKKQLFLPNWKVPELLSCLANVKNGESTHQLLLKGTHASLFHTVRFAIKSNNWETEAKNKQHLLAHELCSESQEHVAKEGADSLTTAVRTANKFLSACLKWLSKSKTKHSTARGHRKPKRSRQLPEHMIPYVLLIRNCLPLSTSSIKSKCSKEEILCRIQYFTLGLWKKEKPKPLSKVSPIFELQQTEETQHIKFLNLKDLQWKLYKGIVKRKQKVTASQRKAKYRPFRIFEEKTTKAEYIIPLISKD